MRGVFLDLAHWRREVADLYRRVRQEPDPAAAHAIWRAGRDELYRSHPQTPLEDDDPIRETGVPYWPYDPALRWSLPLLPAPESELAFESSDGQIRLRRIGQVDLPLEGAGLIDVWWLGQYAGGIWLPLRDGTSARSKTDPAGASYGAGRYLLDSVKGADLGGSDPELTIDLNYLYHPSCRYSPRWACPLAPEGNRITTPIEAGERMS